MSIGSPTPAATVELFAYRALVRLVGTVASAVAAARPRTAWNEVWRERRGVWAPAHRTGTPRVWVHAASVGETGIACSLISGLRRRLPDAHVLLTCNTGTARTLALDSDVVDEVRYFPLDHPALLRPLLDELQPAAYLFVETEIWPCLLLELERRRVPKAMVNARISDRSYPRYAMVRALMRRVLATVDAVCVRDGRSRERLLTLGARPERTAMTGDIKLDALRPEALEATPDLIAKWKLGVPVLLAASTHPGEDEIVLAAFGRVRRTVPTARLVLAPRHPERVDSVLRLVSACGHSVMVWSRLRAGVNWDVLIVDTVGELKGFMKGAAAVFVGGTLVPVGGHNLMEPVALGAPVVTGTSLGSVSQQAETLLDADALAVVEDGDGLAVIWADWLEHPAIARERARRGREALAVGCGALDRTIAMLADHGVI